MKRMKKFAALLLVVAMTFGMVACSSSDKKEESMPAKSFKAISMSYYTQAHQLVKSCSWISFFY